MGMDKKISTKVYTSGEAALDYLIANFKEKKFFHIGPSRDFSLFKTFEKNKINDSIIVKIIDKKKEYFSKKGNYALSLIVHPDVPKKILELNGEIFWFSPQYLKNDLPKIISGVITMDNSGLASISLSSYFNAKSILLSGVKLTGLYAKFLEGKKLVFENALKNKTKIFSLDGVLATKTTFDDWCKF